MRRPGRRIEIWLVNEKTGESRRKGPNYGTRWPPDSVTELEVKLDSGEDPPEFVLYGAPGKTHRASSLKELRGLVDGIATAIADARSKENWREAILVGSVPYGTRTETIEAFRYEFHHALVAEERVRYCHPDGETFGAPQRLYGVAYELPWSVALWEELRDLGELHEWIEEALRDDGDYYDEDEEGRCDDRSRLLFVRYIRGLGRLVRDLRDGKTERVPRGG